MEQMLFSKQQKACAFCHGSKALAADELRLPTVEKCSAASVRSTSSSSSLAAVWPRGIWDLLLDGDMRRTDGGGLES
jgi:hypothetical protein